MHELILGLFVGTEGANWTEQRREPRWVLFGCPDKKCQLPNEKNLKLTKTIPGSLGQTV